MIPRLYRLLLRGFPAEFRDRYGWEAARTFEELWEGAASRRERWSWAFSSYVRLPTAMAAEWWRAWTAPTPMSKNTRGDFPMTQWTRHVRYALRTLWKAPAFTWSAVLLVGLGVGAVTTIFTLVDHILLRPLPYPESERLVTVEEGSHSGPLFREMQTLPGVEMWGAGFDLDVNLTGEGSPQRILEARVSEDFFQVLGAQPVRGRLLSADDFQAADAVVVSGGRLAPDLGRRRRSRR